MHACMQTRCPELLLDADHNFWSIANARKVIGYSPEDNSTVRPPALCLFSHNTVVYLPVVTTYILVQVRFVDAIAKHVAAAKAAGVGK